MEVSGDLEARLFVPNDISLWFRHTLHHSYSSTHLGSLCHHLCIIILFTCEQILSVQMGGVWVRRVCPHHPCSCALGLTPSLWGCDWQWGYVSVSSSAALTADVLCSWGTHWTVRFKLNFELRFLTKKLQVLYYIFLFLSFSCSSSLFFWTVVQFVFLK